MPGIEWKIEWVKGHQDEGRPVEELPQNARLNVLADELATRYYHEVKATSKKSRTNSLFFPSSKIGLIVNGQRITANAPEAMRYHITGTRMRKFLQQQRPSWNDEVWNNIDFASLGMAYKKLKFPRRIQVHKIQIGWLNTGHQRTIITPGSASQCPSCGHEDETQEHVLRCKNRRIQKTRYLEGTKLRSHIVTSLGGSTTWTVLHQCIMTWLEGTTDEVMIPLEKLPMSLPLKTLVRTAIEAQNRIGWHFAMRGYLSSEWIEAQLLEHPRSTRTGIRTQWLSPIITQLWNLYLELWRARNANLHEGTDTNNIRESTVDERLRQHYSMQ